jgi:hypothetical protein
VQALENGCCAKLAHLVGKYETIAIVNVVYHISRICSPSQTIHATATQVVGHTAQSILSAVENHTQLMALTLDYLVVLL